MSKPFFTLRMTNIRDAAGVFRNMADKGAVEHARNLTREVGKIMVEELKAEAPVGKHYTFTGQLYEPGKRLRDSFFYRTYIRGKAVKLGVYVKPDQRKKLGWVIRGTHPFKRVRQPDGNHDERGGRIIRPVRAKALAFYWARKQKSMVLAYVKHPGTLPNPFHERALKKARPKTEKLERRAAKNIAEEMFMRWPKGMVEVI